MAKFIYTVLAVLVLLVAITTAQQQKDPNSYYDGDDKLLGYLFSFRVPLGNGEMTELPSECKDVFSNQYIAQKQAWVEFQSPLNGDEPRPTYPAIALQLKEKQQTCFDGINSDASLWAQNWISACKFRSTCGGSVICGCAADAPCNYYFNSEQEFLGADLCVQGYLCNAPEGETVGKCEYAKKTFKLATYNKTMSDVLFYDIARSGSCSQYGLEITYNLKTSKNLFFSAATTQTSVPETCTQLLVDKFGGYLEVNTNEACMAKCGALECICEKGNTCDLEWNDKTQGHKQCDKKLKCEIFNGNPICNNAVMFSAFTALIIAFITILF